MGDVKKFTDPHSVSVHRVPCFPAATIPVTNCAVNKQEKSFIQCSQMKGEKVEAEKVRKKGKQGLLKEANMRKSLGVGMHK